MLRLLHMFKLLAAVHHYQLRYGLLGLLSNLFKDVQNDCKDSTGGSSLALSSLALIYLFILGKVSCAMLCSWVVMACFKTLSSHGGFSLKRHRRHFRQDFEPLKVAVAQICTNRAHLRLLLDQAELALEDCKKALEASKYLRRILKLETGNWKLSFLFHSAFETGNAASYDHISPELESFISFSLSMSFNHSRCVSPCCTVARGCQVDFQNAKAYWRGTVAALRLPETHEGRRQAAELLRQGLRMAYDGSQALPNLWPGIGRPETFTNVFSTRQVCIIYKHI